MIFLPLLLSLSTGLVLAADPVGGGSWVEDTYKFSIQQCAGGTVSGNTFTLPPSPNGSTSGSGCSNGHLRAERHYDNNYSSGVRQFGGSFKVTSGDEDRVSLKQTFHGDVGPYFILAVDKTGRLYSVNGGTTIAAAGVAAKGKTVRINTIHDVEGQTYEVYVNGAKAYSASGAPTGNHFYDKLGAYTTDSGSGPLGVEWTDVQFWHQG